MKMGFDDMEIPTTKSLMQTANADVENDLENSFSKDEFGQVLIVGRTVSNYFQDADTPPALSKEEINVVANALLNVCKLCDDNFKKIQSKGIEDASMPKSIENAKTILIRIQDKAEGAQENELQAISEDLRKVAKYINYSNNSLTYVVENYETSLDKDNNKADSDRLKREASTASNARANDLEKLLEKYPITAKERADQADEFSSPNIFQVVGQSIWNGIKAAGSAIGSVFKAMASPLTAMTDYIVRKLTTTPAAPIAPDTTRASTSMSKEEVSERIYSVSEAQIRSSTSKVDPMTNMIDDLGLPNEELTPRQAAKALKDAEKQFAEVMDAYAGPDKSSSKAQSGENPMAVAVAATSLVDDSKKIPTLPEEEQVKPCDRAKWASAERFRQEANTQQKGGRQQ